MSPRSSAATPAYEQLGAFYIGRRYDPVLGVTDEDILYDAKDLTTHAVCVGMTGSGKTGLCVGLLEEAAIDGIPALVIDPKGDLGNLLLNFPTLSAEAFEPWVDEQTAARKGETVAGFAARTAAMWKQGLADWGQDGRRVRKLADAVDMTIYTPGSSAGVPLSVLRRFDAPPASIIDDQDAFRERITSAVSGLLVLVGEDPDPITNRAHILLSNILDQNWRAGRAVDLADLIGAIQNPPFDRVGVLDVETFYPAGERRQLAMRLNNLLASPGFAAWMEGEPLDIGRLLHTAEGKPRLSILSISHLSDTERMFFVTTLLNEVVAWMRRQPGTPNLRAILYMDEVFGYFPPTANPPSKTPMLTLLKQARAYGLGVVLSTQNPVDLDYKGLGNAGTWFLGRLQTERDKMRVLDGLESASASSGAAFDRKTLEATLSGLDSRVFLLHNVHDDGPVLFHARWALSYLRGPLTRTQIQKLMAGTRLEISAAAAPAPARAIRGAGRQATTGVQRPSVPPGVTELFVEPDGPVKLYRPALYAKAELHYANARSNIDEWRQVACLAPLTGAGQGDVWANRTVAEEMDLGSDPVEGARFEKLPPVATRAKSYAGWEKKLKAALYRDESLALFKCTALKLVSAPSESRGQFDVRLREAARANRDLAVEKLRSRYAPKLARLQERIQAAERSVEKETGQFRQQRAQTAISVGATVLGALFGRRVASVGTVGRATTAARGVGRAAREQQDIAHATARLEELQTQLQDLETGFQDAISGVQDLGHPETYDVVETIVRAKKTDLVIHTLALVWIPLGG